MNLTLFNYHGSKVRMVSIKDETWFVLKDLCDVLEIGHAPALKQRLSSDVVSSYPIPDSLGRAQDTTIVNEDGMYDVILESRKSEARLFRKWVTSEVLPSIRKTGSYGAPPQFSLPQTFAEALEGYAAELRKSERLDAERRQLQTKIEEDRSKVLFAESLQVSSDSILIGELAKLLKQNGIDIGGTRLFKLLREEGYLMSKGDQYNMPTQRSMDLKIMEIKSGTRGGSDGAVHITRTTKITGKGQIYFINKFKNQTVLQLAE